jgi:hypothetical protein
MTIDHNFNSPSSIQYTCISMLLKLFHINKKQKQEDEEYERLEREVKDIKFSFAGRKMADEDEDDEDED